MRRSITRTIQVTCLAALLVLIGCTETNPPGDAGGGGGNAGAGADGGGSSTISDLRVLGRLYHDHHDVHNRGPDGWDAAIQFASTGDYDVSALERLRTAGYQVQWGKSLREITEGTSNTVLAEAGSGPKLMFDGSVQAP
jgi:CubicO group peptidase (beta-lactamase class C family)